MWSSSSLLTHLQTGRDVFPEFEPLDVPLILDDVLVCNNFDIETNLYLQHLEKASEPSFAKISKEAVIDS